MNEKKQSRLRRAKSTRLHIRALGATRLCVNRTPRHIYAQVISADGGKGGSHLLYFQPAKNEI